MPGIKILCYGDSNTYGYDPRNAFGGRYSSGSRWCDLLEKEWGCRVINMGENGRTVPDSDWSRRILSERIRQEAPELLVILLGTNDLLNETEAPAEIAARMEQLIFMLSREFPALKILLLSPPRIEIPGFSAAAEALSRQYRHIAENRHIGFADCFSWAVPMAFDGVHFSEAGHVSFAQHLSHEIRKYTKA